MFKCKHWKEAILFQQHTTFWWFNRKHPLINWENEEILKCKSLLTIFFFSYTDNPRMNIMRNNKKNPRLILFSIVTALVVFVFLLLGSLWWLWKRLRNMVHDGSHVKSMCSLSQFSIQPPWHIYVHEKQLFL